MPQFNRETPMRSLATGYRRAEDEGFPDVLLAVVFAAGGLATAGVVLLAFVQTHAMVVVALVMAVAATVAVLATIGAMLSGEETAVTKPSPDTTTEQPAESATRQSMTRRARSPEARLPR